MALGKVNLFYDENWWTPPPLQVKTGACFTDMPLAQVNFFQEPAQTSVGPGHITIYTDYYRVNFWAELQTMGKPYHAGMAAAGAVEAVHAAMVGVEGAQEVLGGPFGFGATHHGAGAMSAFDQPDYLFPNVSHKYHACCHGTHAAIEAVLSLRDQIAPQGVERIEIAVHPRWLDVCAIPAPQTRLEAKFSLSATAALALLGRPLDTDLAFEPNVILAPEVTALRDVVEVSGDGTLSDTQAVVRIQSGGERHSEAHDLAQAAPLAQRQSRIRAKAAALIGSEQTEALWGGVHAEGGVNLDALGAVLRGH